MPMYWDAYIADTTHLTIEEHGAYLLLLGAMWRRNGWVPDDDKDNARILGISTAKWRRIKARLSGFLTFENGEISQKNLRKIWENTQEKIQKNRENGSKGGRPRSSKNNDLEKPKGSVSDKPNETIPEPEPEPDTTIANAMDGAAVDATSDAIWKRGVPFLVERHVTEKKARSMIGKWLAQSGSAQLFDALKDAAASPTQDPIPYITAILTKPEQPSTADMMAQAKEINANR